MYVNPLLPLFWEASRRTLIDRKKTHDHVIVRSRTGATTVYDRAQMQEESSTENFARYLAAPGAAPISIHWASAVLTGTRVALHSRGLEAWAKGSPGTGADLEVAIEVAPNRWIDLLLQAKRLKLTGTSDAYEGWNKPTNQNKSTQNQDLVTRAQQEGRIPGMLLYNSLVPPFIDGRHRRETWPWYSCSAFGACSMAKHVMIGDAVWPDPRGHLNPWPYKNTEITPAGVSLCLYQPLLLQRNGRISPSSITPHHFPIEHLFHYTDPTGHESLEPSGNPAIESCVTDDAGSTVETTTEPPGWAADLLDANVADMAKPDPETQDDLGAPAVSIVIKQPTL